MSWVYIRTEPQLWTVGFYAPDGKWHTDSDHGNREEAARRVAFLNSGTTPGITEALGITDALTVARKYGSTDGDHHKAWVIDQMVAALTDGREHMPDRGIAP